MAAAVDNAPRRSILLGGTATAASYYSRWYMGAAAGLLLPAGATAAPGSSGCSLSPALIPDAGSVTSVSDFSGYNNYYEFSTDKKAVRTLAQALNTTGWTVTVEGEVEQPYVMDVSQLSKAFTNHERTYRLRCVEGWSKTVPWQGVSLCDVINRARPMSRAKFVEIVSLLRPAEMLGQRTAASGITWPYREGLRIDEAVHPLTLLATGAYGALLPKQNGGPLRLVVPWKYGFKSAKAVTHIRLVDTRPVTSWNKLAPSEYGFYGNVNPNVPHPRWSQMRENRIGEIRKQPTLLLNGYADLTSGLYQGQDATKLY